MLKDVIVFKEMWDSLQSNTFEFQFDLVDFSLTTSYIWTLWTDASNDTQVIFFFVIIVLVVFIGSLGIIFRLLPLILNFILCNFFFFRIWWIFSFDWFYLQYLRCKIIDYMIFCHNLVEKINSQSPIQY